MKVWGFDPSKTSGIGEWQTERDYSSIWCDIFRMPDECDHYWFGVQIQRKIIKTIKERGKPDIGVVEQQSLNSMGNNLDGVIYPWTAALAFCGILGAYGIPVVRIAPQSWHAVFFGRGFKPPQKPVNKTIKGQKVKTFENDWKAACVASCEQMGIILPTPKSLAHNAADACALAVCWRAANPIATEYHPQFINLVQQRNTRPSADLFGATA